MHAVARYCLARLQIRGEMANRLAEQRAHLGFELKEPRVCGSVLRYGAVELYH
jgi:hypothetical protein